METGEWLTRSTVWVALALYVASEILKTAGGGAGSGLTARWLHSLGCAAFLAHVVCAFHFYHRWSPLSDPWTVIERSVRSSVSLSPGQPSVHLNSSTKGRQMRQVFWPSYDTLALVDPLQRQDSDFLAQPTDSHSSLVFVSKGIQAGHRIEKIY